MDIYDFIRLYHYAKQDAWAVIDGVRDAVLASGRADLLPALDRAQARILEAADVEADVAQAERAQQAKVGTRLAARSLDASVKRLVRRFEVEADMPGGADAAACAGLLAQAWPEGPNAVLRGTFRAKVFGAARLLRLLDEPGNAELCARLRLGEAIAALRVDLATLESAMAPPAVVDMSAEAMERANTIVVWAVCKVIASLDPEVPADVAERDRLLRPLLAVNARIHARLSAIQREGREAEAERRKATCADPLPANAPVGLSNAAK